METKQAWEYTLYEVVEFAMPGVFEEKNSTDFKLAVLLTQSFLEDTSEEEDLFIEKHMQELRNIEKRDSLAFNIRAKAIDDSMDMMMKNYNNMTGRIEYQKRNKNKE